MSIADAIDIASIAVEATGATIILDGLTLSSIFCLNNLRRGDEAKHAYRPYRVSLGRLRSLGL